MLHFSPDQVKVTLREETMGDLRGVNSYKIIYSVLSGPILNTCKLLILMVGAGRFERPTPCAQGGSKGTAKAACFQLLGI
jgi:hypothetical protein